MMAALAILGRRKCSTKATTSKPSVSVQFEDLCYKHLLHGQLKQHSFRQWLFDQADATNWKISVREQWFKLHSDYDTALTLPLQVLGTFSKETGSFLYGHRSPELIESAPSSMARIQSFCGIHGEIPEFKMPFIEKCDENLPYILGSVMISALDIDGYYVASFPYNKSQPTVFVLMDQLDLHSDFKAMEWSTNDLSELMEIWDFTFNFMCTQCGVEMVDNVRIWEELCAVMGIECRKEENVIITDYSTGGAIAATRLSIARNAWQLRDIDIDEKGMIRRVNGIDLNSFQSKHLGSDP